MRRLETDLDVLKIPYPATLQDNFSPIFQTLFQCFVQRGSLIDNDLDINNLMLCSMRTNVSTDIKWFDISKVTVHRKLTVNHFMKPSIDA